jgi:AraC-like DNA-binding protein
MENSDIIQIASFLAPALSALLCLLLLVTYRFAAINHKTSNKIIYIMMIYYGLTIFCWMTVPPYFYKPEVYVYIHPLFSLAVMLSHVIAYRLVFQLTGTGGDEHFPIINYLIPVIVVLVVWSCLSYEEKLRLVISSGEPIAEYSIDSFNYFIFRIEFRVLYTFIYIWLGLRRLKRYRKAVGKYSANYDKSSIGWLYFIYVVSIILTPYPLLERFFVHRGIPTAFVLLLWRFLAIMLQSVLCYNFLSGNYVIINVPKRPKEDSKPESALNKAAFEIYMRKHKPYLEPDLKITDLLLPFYTNYRYMSEFINREYRMNFHRYINTLRLQEMEQMRSNPKYNTMSEVELALAAGFSSYRSYQYLKRKIKEEQTEARPFRN